MHVKFIAKI